MASVIRIKRRIDEDPAEALFLSCKKRRETDSLEVKSVLSFVGTINSKDEPVSKHIKEAIQEKKMRKELHPHMADFRHPSHVPEVTSKLRKETEQMSRVNRYRVTWSRRALDLDLLDKDNDQDGENPGEDSGDGQEKATGSVECNKSTTDGCTTSKKQSDQENKENDFISSPSSGDSDQSITRSPKDVSSDRKVFKNSTASSVEKLSECSTIGDDNKSLVKQDKMFCIFDVENEVEDDLTGMCDPIPSSRITLNDIPLRSKRVTSSPSKESQYVYDLYFTHNNLSELDKEAVLTVEALCDELVSERDNDDPDKDLVYDDEDDSNDENNWRADYPDEDPRFFENADEDYDYAEDMVDTNFLHDDDGDLLAYWMDTRCKVDVDSDDGEDEYEGDEGNSSGSSDEEKEPKWH